MATKFEKCRYRGVRRRVGEHTWSFRLMVNGKEYCRFGYKTAKEANDAREKLKYDLKNTGFSDVLCNKTFDEVYKEYRESKEVFHALSTLKKYDSVYRNHIVSALGNRLITTLTTKNLEDFFIGFVKPQPDKKYGNTIMYSQGYIDGIRKLVNNVFTYAERSKYISYNPMRFVSPEIFNLGVPPKEKRALDENEISKIDDRLKNLNTYTAFRLANDCGMRLGEVFGLLWSDIDFQNREIHIERQMISTSVNGTTVWCFAPLKTRNSLRTISFGNDLYYYLLKLKCLQDNQRETMGETYFTTNHIGRLELDKSVRMLDGDIPLVNRRTVNGRYGEMLTPSSWKRASQIIKQELNMKDISFHNFRHTHTSMCRDEGMLPEVLKNRLGHSDIKTTFDHYRHLTSKAKEHELSVLNKMHIKDIQEVRDEEAFNENVYENMHFYDEYQTPQYDEHESERILGGKFTSYAKGIVLSK